MSDPLITKTVANKCIGAAQRAEMVVGSMLSAYWSAAESQTIPGAFIMQAHEHVNEIRKLLAELEPHSTLAKEKKK